MKKAANFDNSEKLTEIGFAISYYRRTQNPWFYRDSFFIQKEKRPFRAHLRCINK